MTLKYIKHEIELLIINPIVYVKDPWNVIDICCYAITILYIFQIYTYLLRHDIDDTERINLRTYGAIAVLCMWIKCFYLLKMIGKSGYYLS